MTIAALRPRPHQLVPETGERRLSLKNHHAAKLRQIAEEAGALAACAEKIANMADEVTARGGVLIIQPQIAFLTGALARLYKDWAVCESLQSLHLIKKEREPGR